MSFQVRGLSQWVLVAVAAAALAACGGSGGSGGSSGGTGSGSGDTSGGAGAGTGGVGTAGGSATNATITGAITGAARSGPVVLTVNEKDLSIGVSDKTYSFPASLTMGGNYTVSVKSNPDNLKCSLTNGTGVASASITGVNLNCMSSSAEPLPSLANPQAGSIALVGNGLEGVWQTPVSTDGNNYFDVILVDANGQFIDVRNRQRGLVVGNATRGDATWQLAAGAKHLTSGNSVTSNGVLQPSKILSGKLYDRDISAAFDAANALAIAVPELAGTWKSANLTLVFAADGSFTGSTNVTPAEVSSGLTSTMGKCDFKGTVGQPGTGGLRNMFTFKLSSASTSADCKLASGADYNGQMAVMFYQFGQTKEEGYIRSLVIAGVTADGALISDGSLFKSAK